MPQRWCDSSNVASRAVNANQLCPLSDEEASAFLDLFSTVPPCETEDSPNQKMAAEDNQESDDTAEAVRSIFASTSILCDFPNNSALPKCECGLFAQTRPVRFIKTTDNDDDVDVEEEEEVDDELWPSCKGQYSNTHCFSCASKDDRQFLKTPSSCGCGIESRNGTNSNCRRCYIEINSQRDCDIDGCNEKRYSYSSLCNNHNNMRNSSYTSRSKLIESACTLCGEAVTVQTGNIKRSVGKKR